MNDLDEKNESVCIIYIDDCNKCAAAMLRVFFMFIVDHLNISL